jgi:hypothetical protein
MIRSRRAVQVLLLTGIIVSGAFAAPLAYNINFITNSGSPAPTSGSFTYDSALADGAQFSDFLVDWDGFTFDFLTLANSGGTNLGCDPGASIAIFDMMSDPAGACPGTPNVLQWGADDITLAPRFSFSDEGNPASGHNMNLSLRLALPSPGAGAGGSWSITRNDAQTPEPSSFILVLAGGALLALKRIVPGHPEVNG